MIERLPAPVSPAVPDRGRVQVRDGHLLTDKGTRLRGVTFGTDARPDFAFDQAMFDEMAQGSGLNAFHVYLENSALETGARMAQADQLVELTSRAGMYLLVGMGGGNLGGTFDRNKVLSFAAFYAQRYADRSHVLFELQNTPETSCDAVFKPETLDMERDAYATIHAVAPQAHVALFSYDKVPTAQALEGALDAMQGSVDWSKASIAIHPLTCAGADTLPGVLDLVRARGIVMFAGDLGRGQALSVTGRLEDLGVGWFSLDWVWSSTDFAAFRGAHEAAGVTWCPDFGVWPQDSAACRAP